MLIAYKLLAASVAALLSSGAIKSEAPFKAISQMTGVDTSIEDSRVELIQDSASWSDLWHRHREQFQLNVPANAQSDALSDLPKVSFTDNVVLCLFGGQSKNVLGFEIADVGEKESKGYIRIRPLLLPSTGADLLQNPYLFIVLPRTKKKVTVQLDETALGGQGWRTLATLEPTLK
jgi:hypothetical protein